MCEFLRLREPNLSAPRKRSFFGRWMEWGDMGFLFMYDKGYCLTLADIMKHWSTVYIVYLKRFNNGIVSRWPT